MNALADRIAAIDSRLDAAEKEILFLNQMKGDSMDESNSHQMLSSIMEKVNDIDKDVDVLRYGKEGKMSDNALGYLMGANANRGNDAMWAAMNSMNNGYNSPWMYLMFLALFGGGGFGNWGNRGYGYGVQNGIDTNMLLNAIQAGSATSQRDADRMASNFGVTASQLNNGLQALNTSIQQVACGVGTSAQQVINAIQNGDAGIMQAVQSACCENRLAICQQTNSLQQGQWQLGVTMQQQGDMTRALIREQSFEAQIRALQNENEKLRDAAQTTTLQGSIASGDATIMAKLIEIQQSLQTQITAQGYQLQQMQAKTATTGA